MATRRWERCAAPAPAGSYWKQASTRSEQTGRTAFTTGCYWTAACLVLGYAILGSGAAQSPPILDTSQIAAAGGQSWATDSQNPPAYSAGGWCQLHLDTAATQCLTLPTVPAGEKLTALVLAFGSPTESLRVELLQQTSVTALASGHTPWRALNVPPARNAVTAKTRGEVAASVSCSLPALTLQQRDSSEVGVGATRRYAYDDAEVTLTAVWSGRGCRVWRPVVESSQSDNVDWCALLGEFVDAQILLRVVKDQGGWPDVDGDGAVNLVVTDRVGQFSPGLRAFVRKQDFQQLPTSSQTPWDVIHVQPGVSFEELEPILIHELTHVAEFSWCQHVLPDSAWPIPDWLTEGLAHATEMRLSDRWENTLPRLQAFAGGPGRSPLRVVDAGTSGLWRHPGQRGASAAFCDWWTRHDGPVNWPHLILAFRETDDPWQTLTGAQFAELYQHWAVNLTLHGVPAGPRGRMLPLQRQTIVPEQPLQLVLTGTAFAVVEFSSTTLDARPTSLQVQQLNATAPRVQILLLRQPAVAY